MNYRKLFSIGSNSFHRSREDWKRRHHLHLIALFAGVTGFAALIGPSDNAEATRSSEFHHRGPLVDAVPKLETPQATLNPRLLRTPGPGLGFEPWQTEPETVAQPEVTGKEEEGELPWRSVTVKRGDTLGEIFGRLGLSSRDAHEVVHSGAEASMLAKLAPGQEIGFRIEDGELRALEYKPDPLKTLSIAKSDDGFKSTLDERTPEVRTAYIGGSIQNSFYGAAQQAGLSESLILKLAEVFGWDIDFALDVRKGDRFSVLFEAKYLDGEKIRDGEILAAEFVNNGKTYRTVRFTSPDGKSDYYTPDGLGMRKAFIRTPVDFRRISSTFQTERFHPVLGVKRPHRGVDYSAAVGTPIKAAGNGRVAQMGWQGGYGNALVIDHGRTYTTLYGHLSKFASGLQVGSRVQQGETIGYVGATGLATGPHLHYEFRVNGTHKDPLKVTLPNAEPIRAGLRPAFDKYVTKVLAELAQEGNLAIAGADSSIEPKKN